MIVISICKECTSYRVCKVREFIDQYSDLVDIKIEGCKITNKTSAQTPVTKPVTRPDFRELSNAVRQKEAGPNIKVQPKQDTAIGTMSCPSCNGTTAIDDITKCADCGKTICGNCGTHDPEDNKHYCEECWGKK